MSTTEKEKTSTVLMEVTLVVEVIILVGLWPWIIPEIAYIAVGAVSYDVDHATDSGSNEGGVFVYDYDTTSMTWVLKAYMPGDASGDNIGSAIAMSGEGQTVVAGSPIGEFTRVWKVDRDGIVTDIQIIIPDTPDISFGECKINRREMLALIVIVILNHSNYSPLDFLEAIALSNDGSTLAIGAPFDQGG